MLIYLFSHTYVPNFLRTVVHTHVDCRGSEYAHVHRHTCARTSAVPLRTSAAPHRAPTERARRSVRRRPKAAHTWYNEVSDTVFHAPMFAPKYVVE